MGRLVGGLGWLSSLPRSFLIGGGEGFADHAGIAAFASEILVVDPAVGFLKSGAERSVGFPVKELLNSRVVGVASVYAFGSAQVILRCSLMPAISSTMSTNWFTVTASLQPRLIGSGIPEFMMRSIPFTQSSMYMKLRVCSPLPQISISCLPLSFASMTFLQMAAGAFSRPPYQVPHGP